MSDPYDRMSALGRSATTRSHPSAHGSKTTSQRSVTGHELTVAASARLANSGRWKSALMVLAAVLVVMISAPAGSASPDSRVVIFNS